MESGAYAVHKQLREALENYIRSQYFGKSPILLDAVKDKMDREGVLYRTPYIESSPAYKIREHGIAASEALPEWLKTYFQKLADAHLGVYQSPFCHQISALEAASRGEDLFVATGTGSGKTECFLWPLLGKLAAEAREKPKNWQIRGVRAILMYPMNALVSDQISRLRRLIGDPEHQFVRIFRSVCGGEVRRPQFGMYTGRTPYAGATPKPEQDKKLAATYGRMMSGKDETYRERLVRDGKLPAKENLTAFVEKLKQGCHEPNTEDAELVTRFEMQKCCPDILITNYSMLEYMLLRKVEEPIWNATVQWLQADEKNRLLFIIDEAHMYRGSAGGEVSFLLRRLLYRLGIPRSRVQFILTTASMPDSTEEDREAVQNFARELTAADAVHSFRYLTGDRETIQTEQTVNIPFKAFLEADPARFEGTEDDRLGTVNAFWKSVGEGPFVSNEEAGQWMFGHLSSYTPFQLLFAACRGEAKSLNELAGHIFPDAAQEEAMQAVSVLLALAPLARSSDGRVLFPTRMHMLFRGLKGVYACANPDCPHGHTAGTLRLGEIYLSDGQWTCPACGSAVYELYNDRRCGALFFKGYVRKEELERKEKTYLWHQPGIVREDEVREIHLFIPPDDFVLSKQRSSRGGEKRTVPCYLDVKSGFIDFGDDSLAGRPGVRKLYYSTFTTKGRPNVYTFSRCPHCLHQLSGMQLTSFGTKGNQSFFNLIKAQFEVESAVSDKTGQPDRYPNEGRKVLLFSDSRQRAAKLARDMSDASDMTAARQTAVLALKRMEESGKEYTLDEFYDFFAMTAAEHHVHLFHGEQQKQLLSEGRQALEKWKKSEERQRKYKARYRVSDAGNLNSLAKQLLRFYCGGYNTMIDTASSWIDPMQDVLWDAIDDLDDDNICVAEEDFKELFNAWFLSICDRYMALGNTVSDICRESVRRLYDRYGLPDDWKFSEVIRNIMGWTGDSREENLWKEVLNNYFLRKGESGQWYVQLSQVRPRLDRTHVWHQCGQCSGITPYPLKERCPFCGSRQIHVMTETDFLALDFWRKPVNNTLCGEPIRVIDTEEHTAQLSHKDQRDNLWAKTEEYELRFQDFTEEGELPVDILSSTTTMEVGIDIGSLVAVGLRNIPPMRENYQQRAGRVGRRGASLSTIVTFCEDGPHDSLYFTHPEPMFRGDPRRPWIDIRSEKIVQRHLNMVALQAYLREKHYRMDQLSAEDFFQSCWPDFPKQLSHFHDASGNNLVPAEDAEILQRYQPALLASLAQLADKVNRHPELFSGDGKGRKAVSLLDALYEEGIVPTYSFPKNVVSTYISDGSGRVQYQVECGLDVAIGEYAPGRAIVVDKTTYQIGGLYYPGSEWRSRGGESPARTFMEDPNYQKEMKFCPKCGWFGLEEDSSDICPFCGNQELIYMYPMLRPWGFAPKDGKPIETAQLMEEYSAVQQPLYSTLPDADDVHDAAGCRNIRMAVRSNQRIIMLNRGLNGYGFAVCRDCGAAMPCTSNESGNEAQVLKKSGPPYLMKRGKTCKHRDIARVNLGYDFITDMLVLEFRLDSEALDVRPGEGTWLSRAGRSLAEALRLAACQEMDIEFNELVTGYRLRRNHSGVFVDVYLYDSLSSGAGYAVGLEHSVKVLLDRTKALLSGCSCETACYQCLKHYYNQPVHGLLDRHAALDLLQWGVNGELRPALSRREQLALLQPMMQILQDAGIEMETADDAVWLCKGKARKEICVYPSMWARPRQRGVIYVSDGMLKQAKPFVLERIEEELQ